MMTEPSDPIFLLFHKYNKLVRRELVKPLTCKTCDTPLITTMGKNDELVLKCFTCASITTPGISTIEQVRAVVSEHFLDD